MFIVLTAAFFFFGEFILTAIDQYVGMALKALGERLQRFVVAIIFDV